MPRFPGFLFPLFTICSPFFSFVLPQLVFNWENCAHSLRFGLSTAIDGLCCYRYRHWYCQWFCEMKVVFRSCFWFYNSYNNNSNASCKCCVAVVVVTQHLLLWYFGSCLLLLLLLLLWHSIDVIRQLQTL